MVEIEPSSFDDIGDEQPDTQENVESNESQVQSETEQNVSDASARANKDVIIDGGKTHENAQQRSHFAETSERNGLIDNADEMKTELDTIDSSWTDPLKTCCDNIDALFDAFNKSTTENFPSLDQWHKSLSEAFNRSVEKTGGKDAKSAFDSTLESLKQDIKGLDPKSKPEDRGKINDMIKDATDKLMKDPRMKNLSDAFKKNAEAADNKAAEAGEKVKVKKSTSERLADIFKYLLALSAIAYSIFALQTYMQQNSGCFYFYTSKGGDNIQKTKKDCADGISENGETCVCSKTSKDNTELNVITPNGKEPSESTCSSIPIDQIKNQLLCTNASDLTQDTYAYYSFQLVGPLDGLGQMANEISHLIPTPEGLFKTILKWLVIIVISIVIIMILWFGGRAIIHHMNKKTS